MNRQRSSINPQRRTRRFEKKEAVADRNYCSPPVLATTSCIQLCAGFDERQVPGRNYDYKRLTPTPFTKHRFHSNAAEEAVEVKSSTWAH
jgi:hypothetical protein